ncbi:ABC transporter permease [Lacticaseibacillus saniviri]|uniref:ABC-type dipeptide oligopeptide nickel transport system, permease component n=1 Tax=Lacticaseibacillus saniviri JCM 17471 = DSM 24301 TaxID=1293598 RepID=A0A0R2N6G3_9LACO|nr:ABC transporter permease [Lacticaseibacillus saniviri]KRO18602.1 ABC-type dipeptide oligopeptide nickel transport system, permease component [Lacticaseibacillus saniviri JCM 17471 = DSM 24301]MCG4282139.1 ABC transporter permease [Lacticaseibacillus saniviri]
MQNKVIEEEIEATPSPSAFRVILREFLKDRVAIVSLAIALIIILGALIGSFFVSADQVTSVNILNRYLAPGQDGFILGTDEGGRDLFKYLILATRNSVFIGVSVALLVEFIGVVVGTISGYYGGRVDSSIMRIVDFWMVLPSFLIIIVLVTIVPSYSPVILILIMTAFSWMTTVRLVRSQVLSQAKREYVMASKTSGTSNFKIMFAEVLPNISSIIITDLTITIAASIGIETGLSFLGFGLPANTPSLGTLIGYATNPEIITNRPWVWLPAALVLLVLSLSINFVGQALRRAADARQRRG